MSAERFYIDQDNDSHWYVIPVSRSEEWEEWRALDSDDARSWDTPSFAEAISGPPSLVNFARDWTIG